jgi:glycyl-tRNA synthetase
MEHSGVSLEYTDEATGERFIPHVVEPTFGIGRTILAVLLSAYTEDEMGGEKRAYLKLKPTIAPIKAAVFPLVKNKENLVKKAQEVYANLKKEIPSVMWDDNGNIGKRYRRQDEIGTPFCITVDHDTLEDDSVTVRDRDTGEQERISTKELVSYIEKAL